MYRLQDERHAYCVLFGHVMSFHFMLLPKPPPAKHCARSMEAEESSPAG